MDFVKTLDELAFGQVREQLSDRLHHLVEAVEQTGLAGKLTLTLSVKREGKVAVVAAKVTTSVPQPPLAGTVFFFGRDGDLTRDDPKQLTLESTLEGYPREGHPVVRLEPKGGR